MNTPTVSQMKRFVDTERGLLDRQIFFSQEIYQQELERIFARCWLYLGHETQIPNPNDFIANLHGGRSDLAVSWTGRKDTGLLEHVPAPRQQGMSS
jgi:ethylbenzene dioxygenase subunit alpha